MSARLLAVLLLGIAACGEVTTTFIDAAPIDGVATCEPACDPNATCTGTTCACEAGFTGDGVTCTDVDECVTNNGGCSANGLCTNTAGSRTCACVLGYVGDGITCNAVWQRVGNFQSVNVNPDNFGAVAVGVGTKLFFAPETNTAGNGFWRSFDTTTMVLSGLLTLPPVAENDFCACGATQAMFSDGTFVYMLGNYAQRYSITGNAWSQIPGYTSPTDLRRGEAGGVYVQQANIGLMVGGRGPVNNALRIATASNPPTFSTEPGTLPFSVDSAAAWAMAGNSTVYAAGGFASDNNRRHLVRHQAGTTTWEPLADAPADIGSAQGMGNFGNRLWVANRTHLQFYNLGTSVWDRTVALPANTEWAATNADGTFAIAQNGGSLEIWKLMQIE